MDQYSCLGVEIAKDWCMVAEKGKTRAEKCRPILANWHLDKTYKIGKFEERNRLAARVRRTSMGRKYQNTDVVKELEARRTKTASIILGCSKCTSKCCKP